MMNRMRGGASMLLVSALSCSRTDGSSEPPPAAAAPDGLAPAKTPPTVPWHRFGGSFAVHYEGFIDLEGHLATPGQTLRLSVDWQQTCNEARVCHLRRVVGDEAAPEEFWVTEEAVWRSGPQASRLSEPEADALRRSLQLVAPTLLREMNWQSRVRDGHAGQSIAAGPPCSGTRRVAVDVLAAWEHCLTEDEGLPSDEILEVTFAHPRLGDVRDSARHGDFIVYDGISWPSRIVIDHHAFDHAWRGELSLVEAGVFDGPLEAPSPPEAVRTPEASMSRLQGDLWQVEFPAADARSFVVDMGTFLVVLEAPLSSELGERLVDLIGAHLPNKPIRHAAFSHHHPHYTGGLRALLASGASIIAPPNNAELVHSIAKLPFTMAPDRLAKSSVPYEVVEFDGEHVISSGRRELVAIDIGASSNHTDEYVVFWLPREGILIEADLGWTTLSGGEVRVGSRAKGLLDAIERRRLPVRTLVQAWPTVQDPLLDFETWRALVLAR